MSLFGDDNYYFNEAASFIEQGILEKGLENIDEGIELACESLEYGIKNAIRPLLDKIKSADYPPKNN